MAERKQRDWRDEELRAACEAYLDMREAARQGRPLVKTQVYRTLAERFGRSESSFEFRMQNISAVLASQGRPWLAGLKPKSNVGTQVTGKIESLLAELEALHTQPDAAFEIEVQQRQPPAGNCRPATDNAVVTQWQRDPNVKAWLLQHANGHCECCGQEAPFTGNDGLPFLEVHHVVHLADNGPDTVDNAVAICPNCHRALHYARNQADLLADLYRRIARLKPVTPAS